MPAFISRGNAVRLIVLLVVTALALSWLHIRARSAPDEALADASVSSAQAAAKRVRPTSTPGQGSHAKRDRQTSRYGAVRSKHPRPSRESQAPPRQSERLYPGGAGAWAPAAGRDISWPQCPPNVGFQGRNGLGQPMPDPGVKFVIVGLTNGRAFTPNPCLDMHLRWVRTHKVFASAYAFAAYPTRAQLRQYRNQGPYDGRQFLGSLMNAGHAAARYNVQVMRQHGFVTPHVWLDVEPSSSRPWSGRPGWNSAVVRGWVRGYRDAGYTVGFYSTTNLWRTILGGLRLGLPEWRTAGPVSSAAALRKCHSGSFQGGRAVIAQWWTERRDFDRLCPSASRGRTLSQYFHKW